MRDTNWEFKLFIKLPLRKQSLLLSIVSALFRGKSHEYACIGKPRQTFPNQSFHQIIDINSSTKTKMGNFAKRFWSQQHPVFPGGHPSKYWLGSMLLNFSDRTRTGVFNMIWPLARVLENVNSLFLQYTSTFDKHQHQLILWRCTFFVPVTSS